MKKLFTILFILLASNILPQQNVSVPQKFALVIGNGNYSTFGTLANTLNDANDMAVVLRELGFTVDKVLDGSRVQMIEAITLFKNRLSVSKHSYGFFFYAGHGLQFNGVNYLIPVNAEIPSANYLGDTSISVQTMLAELNDARNELNIIVLDACRDFPAAWNRSTNRGLAIVTGQPADSIIVFATSAGSTSADGTGRNGLFTGFLLKNLKTPGLDVSEIFKRTGADVSRASNREQIPAVYNQFFGNACLDSLSMAQSATTSIPIVQP
ncbi:MAG: caspase family protein, partial [Treponema sp.]|nr:caspase family protein [Treponema sp.]